ncbi:MAG: MerR family transcriptional regulator [Candidatus Kapaibacterium sp.]|nr:MerR family transcriptional regulator [Ignavibacteriota bacterium]MCB9220906.1 MerR family transcriptional regulator [Ignavibacteria bacterium]
MKKLYWSISEVCELLNVEPHVIRYWESEVTFLKSKRSRGGNRRFDKVLVDKMLLLKELLYTYKLTTKQASYFINKNSDLNDDNIEEKVYAYKKSKGYKEVIKQVTLTDLQGIKKRLEETIELLRT